MLNFVDASFSTERIANYKLSLQVGLNALSYCIYDKELKKHVVLKDCYYRDSFLAIGDLTIEVSRLLKAESLIKYFRKCSCICISPISTFIPENLFVKEELAGYLNFVAPMQDLDEIHYNHIPDLKAYFLHKIYTPLVAAIKSNFDTVVFFNQSYLVYTHALSVKEDNSIHLDFNSTSMGLTLFRDKAFELSNTFNVKSEEDILYYLGAVITEYHLTQDIKVYISGDITREGLKSVYSYFPNITTKENSRLALLLNKDITFRLHNLLYLSECE